MFDELQERITRERLIYDNGLKLSGTYSSLLSSIRHGPAMYRHNLLFNSIMTTGKDKYVLELGSKEWVEWIDFENHSPKRLTCINISRTELLKGVQSKLIRKLDGKIEFLVMDAHHLGLKDNSYDMVFGYSILHHLDIEKVLKEIYRILRPGGTIIFCEPLIYNPVAYIIRLLTPNYRTKDEKPLGINEIKIIGKYFTIKKYFYQFMEPLFTGACYYIVKTPINSITKLVDRFDAFIEKIPPIKYLFRTIIIYGIKK